MSALAVATATMFGGGALMLGASLLAWTPDRNPRAVLGALLVVSLLCAVVAVVLNERLDRRLALAMVVSQVACIATLSATTHDDVAALANGAIFAVVASYATWFLHPVAGRVVVYGGALAWAWVVASKDIDSAASFAAQILLQAVLAAEAFALIRRRMERLVRTDHLTGLPNRQGILEYAEHVLARSARGGGPTAIVMIDLDDLREINNRAGHLAGDELIRSAARYWSDQLGPRQRIGRLGGDEFVLVLPGLDADGAERLMDRWAALSPAAWSAGVAVARAGADLVDVLHRADEHMYRRKRGRRAPSNDAAEDLRAERVD